ncbi:MAG: UbiA family prenyltransferase [Nitrospirota bacterium]
MNTITACRTLCRLPISFFAACSALTGYLLTPDRDRTTMALLVIGVFLLASGASALNQHQERHIDALMQRTRQRPLPRGTIAPGSALALAAGLMICGIILLGMIGPGVAAFGVFAILWYNGLYTPLKQKTAFAAVPGALVGAVPPAMGWLAGRGDMTDPKLFALTMLFFLWQIPHFWLLLLGENDEYAKAGLPSMTRVLPRQRLAGIVILWTASAAAASLTLPIYGIAASPLVLASLVVFALWTTASSLALLRADAGAESARTAFRIINIFLAVIMVLIALDPFLRRK